VSIPPLPKGLAASPHADAANALHTLAIRLLRRARAADRKTGLSPERLSLLSVLAYAGPKTVGALAEAEGVSAPAISRSLTSLEGLGLARRERAGADARSVLVRATPKGRRLMEEGRRRRLEIIAAMLARLDRRDVATLKAIAGVLQKLDAAADARGAKTKM
jgi:DNA-binding MarR family transcriptional regulator